MSTNSDDKKSITKTIKWVIGVPVQFLLGFAEVTAQRPNQTPNSESRFFFYARVGLFVLLTTGAVLLLEPALVSRFGSSSQPEFTNLFSPSRWKVLVADAIRVGENDPCEGSIVSKNCPAHSKFVLPAQTPKELNEQAASFWMIYDLTDDETQTAERALANILFLDRINGREKVYINGTLMSYGSSRPERGILSVLIPTIWLKHQMRIAVWVELDIQVEVGTSPASSFPKNVGLTNSDNLGKFVRVRNFSDENIQLILASIYFMLTGFFLLLWSVVPQQREPFVFALYSLVCGLLAARQSASTFYALPTYQWYHLELFLYVAQAIAVIWAGLALARIRREIGFTLGTMLVCFYAFWTMTSQTATEYYHGSILMTSYFLPWAYLTSALMCLLQSNWISHYISARHADWLKGRRTYLLSYCAVFLYLFLVHIWSPVSNGIDARPIQFVQYSPILVILWVAYGMFHDIRTKATQNEFAPLSRYHRMSPMPERVQGILLDIDLKRSESLYRAASYSSDQNMFVAPFVDSWISIIRGVGGDLIQFQGDMILVLFETPNPSLGAISNLLLDISDALIRMDQLMMVIANELEQRTLVSIRTLIERPSFRATISFGTIAPTLIGQGGNKIAAWMNADDKQVLVRMSRLGDAERLIVSSSTETSGLTGSTLVIDEETIPLEAIQQSVSFFEGKSAQTKSGVRTYLKSKESIPPILTIIYLPVPEKVDFKRKGNLNRVFNRAS